MSRVLVVSVGVPSFVPSRRHGGPGLRATHFAQSLVRAGHDVLLLAVVGESELPGLRTPANTPNAWRSMPHDPEAGTLTLEFTSEPFLLSAAMRTRIAEFHAEAVVGVTVYAAALAARLRTGLPLWADVFGDLMAEGQAKASRTGSDWSIVHFWTLLRTVLEAADRFSAVSVAQSHALVGQLGLAGRLSARTAGEALVAVIPCAAELPSGSGDRDRVRREIGFAADDFVLLLSGGVNTWCDVETLCEGVSRAIAADSRICIAVTGGAIAGHDDTSFPRLAGALERIDRNGSEAGRARVCLLGWIDSARLGGVYAAADLALHIERPLYERTLGAENRVVEWLAHGLPVVTTALSETGRRLVTDGIAFACEPADPADLARVIHQVASRPDLRAEVSGRGRRWVSAERDYASTAAPLVEWCAKPQAAGDREGARLVQLGLLSHPETSAEMLEAYVAALPFAEIARRGVRWALRRARSATIGAFGAFGTSGAKQAARRPHPRHVVSAAAMLLLFAFAMFAGGCNGGRKGGGAARPNILLLSIDTLRADHLGAYGYGVHPSATPWMDRLAARGVTFEHAISSAPETAPALATLVTGVYQDRHGVLFNRAVLGDESHTLAERLKEAGYATAALLGNWLVDPAHGFGQGFDQVEMMPGGEADSKSGDDKLVAVFGDFLREREAGKTHDAKQPWFVWMHMMDPHGPYNSAPAWWSRKFDYAGVTLARDGEFPVSDSNFGLGVIPRYQKLDDARLLSDYVRRYDGELRFTDTQVGSVLALLEASGAAEDTIVVLTADHGESLVEHDELLQHGWFVYDTTVRVPMIVSWPAGLAHGGAHRVDKEVCSVDIVPTLLDLVGVDAGDDSGVNELDGRSLAPELGAPSRGPAPAPGSLRDAGCFVVGPRANHPIALRTGTFKTIVTPAGAPTDPRAAKGERSEEPERVEIYALADDPGETVNKVSERKDVADDALPFIAKMRARFRASGWRW